MSLLLPDQPGVVVRRPVFFLVAPLYLKPGDTRRLGSIGISPLYIGRNSEPPLGYLLVFYLEHELGPGRDERLGLGSRDILTEARA